MVSERFSRIINYVHYQAFYFIFYGSYIPFLLYFPIYLKHIGFNPVQVGVISGIRPIFQSIATPLLVLIGDKFHSRKLLFIISCLIGVVKLICLFLLLKPSNQQCLVTYVEYANDTKIVTRNSFIIDHELSKRDVMDRWLPQGKNQDDTALKKYFDQTLLGHKADGKAVKWQENDANGNNKEYDNITRRMDKKQSVLPEKNDTILNPNITRSLDIPAGKRNHSKTDYRISNDKFEVRRLFYSLLVVALITDTFDAATFTLVDHSCIDHQGKKYGFSRLWGTVGWGIMAPIIAIVMHNAPHEFCGRMVDTYHYVFIFAIVFFNISLLIGSHLELNTDFATDIKVKKVHGTRSNFHYGMFLIVFAYAGFCNGFLFTFVNWFIDTLGGNAGIMGAAAGCRGIVDVVLFFLLKKIIDYSGHVPIVSLGLVGYIAMFIAFSHTTNPWLVVVIEFFHAIFYCFLVSTCAYFLNEKVPAGSNVRMQALLHGIYWGVGSGSGALFSGIHVNHNGFKETFIIFTWMTTAVGFIYLTVELLTIVIDTKINDDIDKLPTSSTGSDADISSEGASEQSE